MPRIARISPGGLVYHALNRGVARLALFEKEADYAAFERVLVEAQEKHPTRILAYCLMPNHWHFLLWPRKYGELTDFLRWLTHTHTMRWHAHHQTQGTGHLYQGRFKAFPVQTDEHFYAVARYIERNPVRASLVKRAENWQWSSASIRNSGPIEMQHLLANWPIPLPKEWLLMLNRPETEADLTSMRDTVSRCCPMANPRWQSNVAVRLGLEYTLRPRGRPRKQE
jgi:REP-associated tyrosine transposase